jgi:prevent-host-death family protein
MVSRIQRERFVKEMTIGELKARFAEVLEKVREGETVIISYGKKKQRVAAIVPYAQVRPKGERALGVLQGVAKYRIRKGFALSDEEFLAS